MIHFACGGVCVQDSTYCLSLSAVAISEGFVPVASKTCSLENISIHRAYRWHQVWSDPIKLRQNLPEINRKHSIFLYGS